MCSFVILYSLFRALSSWLMLEAQRGHSFSDRNIIGDNIIIITTITIINIFSSRHSVENSSLYPRERNASAVKWENKVVERRTRSRSVENHCPLIHPRNITYIRCRLNKRRKENDKVENIHKKQRQKRNIGKIFLFSAITRRDASARLFSTLGSRCEINYFIYGTKDEDVR